MTLDDIKNDWRITGDEDFLLNAVLHRKAYDGDDHEHCVLCWHKFMKGAEGMENCSSEGYVTDDGEYWICDTCFNDLWEPFGWSLKQKKGR
jgi:hypothetical protein